MNRLVKKFDNLEDALVVTVEEYKIIIALKDGETKEVGIYEVRTAFKFRNMIIVVGHEEVVVIDLDTLEIARNYI